MAKQNNTMSEEKKAYLREWQANNRDKVRESCRKSHQKHKEERNAKSREYNQQHKEAITARATEWNKAHQDILNARARERYRQKKLAAAKEKTEE